MGLPRNPLHSVFPILKISPSKEEAKYSFIGTGFLVSKEGKLLTAKHVFMDAPLGDGEHYAILKLPDSGDGELKTYVVEDVNYSESFDIASGEVQDQDIDFDFEPLEIAQNQPPVNNDVLAVEFSRTRSELNKQGQKALIFTPSFRKGNVVSIYFSEYPETVRTEVLELSFSALKGASGAPVIEERTGFVCGLVVANIERDLMPAQVIRVEEGNIREEVKYFLPNGKAVSWRHIREFVSG